MYHYAFAYSALCASLLCVRSLFFFFPPPRSLPLSSFLVHCCFQPVYPSTWIPLQWKKYFDNATNNSNNTCDDKSTTIDAWCGTCIRWKHLSQSIVSLSGTHQPRWRKKNLIDNFEPSGSYNPLPSYVLLVIKNKNSKKRRTSNVLNLRLSFPITLPHFTLAFYLPLYK